MGIAFVLRTLHRRSDDSVGNMLGQIIEVAGHETETNRLPADLGH